MASDVFCFLFKKKWSLPTSELDFCRVDVGVWNAWFTETWCRTKAKIGKYFVTHFPPFLNWCIRFFMDFILTDCLTCNELLPSLLNPPPPELNWKQNICWRKCILEKKENKQKIIILHVLLPLMFCVTGPLYQSVHCLKKEEVVSPHIAHKLLRWLICMNIEHVQVFISLLVQRLAKYKEVRLWRR